MAEKHTYLSLWSKTSNAASEANKPRMFDELQLQSAAVKYLTLWLDLRQRAEFN